MWHEFRVSLMDVIQIDDETVKLEDSGIRSRACIDLTTIKRFYATKQGEKDAVLLVFDDGENMIVWDSWKDVKQAMQPITNI